MLINDVIALAMQVPPMLAAQWATWFFVGLVLSIWGRREKARLVVHGGPKTKSGVRPPAPQKQAKVAPAAATSEADNAEPFADLDRLFNEPAPGAHRRPGDDSPVLAEMARPLAAPQSLP